MSVIIIIIIVLRGVSYSVPKISNFTPGLSEVQFPRYNELNIFRGQTNIPPHFICPDDFHVSTQIEQPCFSEEGLHSVKAVHTYQLSNSGYSLSKQKLNVLAKKSIIHKGKIYVGFNLRLLKP